MSQQIQGLTFQTQTRSRKNTAVKKKQQQQQMNQIISLQSEVKKAFENLEKSYSSISQKNQSYLLKVYLKTFDKMLDGVFYAQQKLNTIDCQHLKDQKCNGYIKQIGKYQQLCIKLKDQITQKKSLLKKHKNITNDLISQTQQLQFLCNKKEQQAKRLKQYIQLKNYQQQEDKNNRIAINMHAVIQDFENQKQSPIEHREHQRVGVSLNNQQRKINKDRKYQTWYKPKQNILQIASERRNNRNKIAQKSEIRSQRQLNHKKQQIQMISNSLRLFQADIEPIENFKNKQKWVVKQQVSRGQTVRTMVKPRVNIEKFDKMSSSLWLYKPMSLRRSKFRQEHQNKTISISLLKNRFKNAIQCDNMIQKDRIFQTEQSTKRDSQIDKPSQTLQFKLRSHKQRFY